MEKNLKIKWENTKKKLDELATGEQMNEQQFKALCEFGELMKAHGYYLETLGSEGRLMIWKKHKVRQ